MRKFFEDTPIRIRVMMALMLPLLGMLGFSIYTVVERYQLASEMETVEQAAVLTTDISALIHELQKERGASALFLGSKGTKFGRELDRQRTASNERKANLESALGSFDASALGKTFVVKLRDVRGLLGKLDGVRSKVSAQSIGVKGAVGYYSKTIATFLDMVALMALNSSDARVSNSISAYLNYMHSKEHAGQERAIGAAGFAAGKFNPFLQRRFIELIGAQMMYRRVFDRFATPQQRQFRVKTVVGKSVDEVAAMRKIALASVETGNTGNVVAAVWFKTITGKIDLMKTVEDRIAKDLATLSASVRSGAASAFKILGAIALLLLMVTVIVVRYIVNGITRPLAALTDRMTVLSEGDKTIEIAGLERKDEIGEMSRAVQVFKDGLIRADELAAESEKEQKAKMERARRVDEVAKTFDETSTEIVHAVTSAATEMQATAESMAATAEETGRQATAVAAASEQASANVGTVASATEELSSSIKEISRQVEQSSAVTTRAVEEAKATNTTIEGLSDAANKIGEVIEMISDIAEQTNLLALNATIEAARAGDAGKGFAVVADEVKTLATQTGKATDEISAQVGTMQTATIAAVEAIGSISKTIAEVSDIAAAIASAVEEQSATTEEIARNVQEAASGTEEVSTNITSVNEAADETGKSAGQVLESAGNLNKLSEDLRGHIETFITDIRAA